MEFLVLKKIREQISFCVSSCRKSFKMNPSVARGLFRVLNVTVCCVRQTGFEKYVFYNICIISKYDFMIDLLNMNLTNTVFEIRVTYE